MRKQPFALTIRVILAAFCVIAPMAPMLACSCAWAETEAPSCCPSPDAGTCPCCPALPGTSGDAADGAPMLCAAGCEHASPLAQLSEAHIATDDLLPMTAPVPASGADAPTPNPALPVPVARPLAAEFPPAFLLTHAFLC